MTTLIDALKGLQDEMDRSVIASVGFYANKLSRIIAEHERIGGWMPIYTAPKSIPVLLWWSTCTTAQVGRWETEACREGWKCEGDDCIPKNQKHCTHWQPLPKGPQ